MKVLNKQKLENGDMLVTIEFDITQHGHYFGVPRNYDLKKVTQLIRSKRVQDAINSGYALGYYGHGKRDLTQKHPIAKEHDNQGREIYPVAKTTKLSINGNMIKHTQHIINTSKSDFIIRYIESGFGGFSFVWNVDKGDFYGADYVLSPNFNGNRATSDVICEGNSCKVRATLDSILMDDIKNEEEIEQIKSDLLVFDGLVTYNAISRYQDDRLEEAEKALADALLQIEEHRADKEFYQGELNKADKALDTANTTIDSLNKTIQAKDIELDSISNSMPFDDEGNIDMTAFGNLVVQATHNNSGVQLDSLLEDFKKDKEPKSSSTLNAIEIDKYKGFGG